jgi:hypothetical protein
LRWIPQTIEILKAVNTRAFEILKEKYTEEVQKNPMTAPILLEVIAIDIVTKDHGFSEDEYKSACVVYQLIKDQEIGKFLQKQSEEIAKLQGDYQSMMMGTSVNLFKLI